MWFLYCLKCRMEVRNWSVKFRLLTWVNNKRHYRNYSRYYVKAWLNYRIWGQKFLKIFDDKSKQKVLDVTKIHKSLCKVWWFTCRLASINVIRGNVSSTSGLQRSITAKFLLVPALTIFFFLFKSFFISFKKISFIFVQCKVIAFY